MIGHEHMALPPDEIHLWLARYDEVPEERLTDLRALLDDEERVRETRFYFPRDRKRYLVTRALVRTVLSKYGTVRPSDWVFAADEYGRPHFTNSDADPALSFNISHTHSLIVLGVASGRALGVDVENLANRDAPVEIADRFFAPPEVAALAAVPAEAKRYRFFEYWTFKESYIKARGMGLSIPLDMFHFAFPHDRAVELRAQVELNDDPQRWQFWQFRADDDYLVAVCAERAGARLKLIVRQTGSLTAAEVLAPALLRTSE